MLPSEDFDDVEIYVRHPSVEKGSDEEEFVYGATYQEMARSSSPYIRKQFTDVELGPGRWEVGIRERGDERKSLQFEVSEPGTENSGYDLNELLASLLNNWRH